MTDPDLGDRESFRAGESSPTLHCRRFSVPLATPLGTAHGEVAEREGFVVRVEYPNRESPGLGEATPFPGWTESLAECREKLSEVPGISYRFPGLAKHPAARHGLGLAYKDAEAREAGVPLAESLARGSLGAVPSASETVPVNATVGDGDIGETVAAAEGAVAEGFGCLKVKVGVRDVDADVERLRAVRAAVGDDVAMRADANGAWTRSEAVAFVDAVVDAGLDLSYVEQPLPADDLDGHVDLRGRGVDVALDESLAARDSLVRREIKEREAADVVVLKPMALGGPLATVDAAVRFREDGIEPVVTTTIDAVVARTAAVHVAAAIPDVRACGLATGHLLAGDLAADPAPVADGTIRVPEGPGIAGDAFDDLLSE